MWGDSRGDGGVEYLLLLGGVCLVAIIVLLLGIQFLGPAADIVETNLNQVPNITTIFDDDGGSGGNVSDDAADGIHLVENNRMGLAFEQDAGGNISLFQIIHMLGANDYYFDVESLPFLKIETRTIGGAYSISSYEQSELGCDTSIDSSVPGSLEIEWDDCSIDGDVQDNGFDIRLEVRLEPGESFSRWRISVDNRMTDYSLRSVALQLGIESLKGGADYGLITPFWLLREPSSYESEAIPSNVIANELAFRLPYAYYDQTKHGVYIDHRTPFPSDNLGSKWWNDDDHFWYAFTYYPSYDNKAGNDYAMEWDTVLGVFDGDWYDLAQIQRAVFEEEDILDKKLSNRTDIPTYWKEADISILRPGGWETVSEEVSDVQSIVGYYDAPNIHIYYPTVFDFETDLGDYDEFLGLSETFNQLKQNGVRTSTYTHARAVGKDTVAASLIKGMGKACKSITGTIMEEGPYLLTDISSYDKWGAFYAGTVAKDFFDAGFSGAFADNPFSFPFLTCYGDPSHPDGPGPHHMKGVVSGISQMRAASKALNPEFIVFYEGVNEFLIPITDAGPSSTHMRRYDTVGFLENVLSVPFYEVMFHDYIPQGAFPIFYEFTPLALADYDLLDSFTAATFAWGQIITIGEYYMGPQKVPIHDIDTVFDIQSIPEAKLLKENTEYIKKLVALKKLGRKYLVYGRMLRPLDVEQKILIADGGVIFPGGVPTNAEIKNEVPIVWSTVWRASDGDTALVFANYNDTAQTVEFDMDFSDYGLNGTYDLRDIQTGMIIGVLQDGDNAIVVPPTSGLILELE
jgi:hypothetical protein